MAASEVEDSLIKTLEVLLRYERILRDELILYSTKKLGMQDQLEDKDK